MFIFINRKPKFNEERQKTTNSVKTQKGEVHLDLFATQTITNELRGPITKQHGFFKGLVTHNRRLNRKISHKSDQKDLHQVHQLIITK